MAVPAPFISRPSGSPSELFGSPPAAFGPVPIWWWSGDPLHPSRLREQMELLIAGGIRQAVVLNLAPSGPLNGALADEPAFFTEAWWALFERVCRDADELGFSIWFYDQLGFSGANVQGNLVQREPTCRGRALEHVLVEVDGEGTVRCPPLGEPLAAFALASDGAVTPLVLLQGAASWSGTGRRRLLLAYAVERGFDYLDEHSCALLVDSVHGEFERRVGQHLGRTIVGSFQDELPSMPTWSTRFAREFQRRRGYDLVPQLAALWGHGAASVRADYQRTRAELAEESFFRPLATWHHDRGLVVGCDQQHPSRAGYPLETTQQYADYLRTHRWFSASGSDHWGEAKVHSSLAHLYDRPRTWLEGFHSTGWGGTLEETYDWLLPWLRAGVTLYNPHAVYYSTGGGRWEWAPPSTCWRQPYWRHHKVFAQAVTRLCAVLSWGDHLCDVAVLFPTTAVQREVDLGLSEELLGQPEGTSEVQDAYLGVVGRMHWFEPEPGALDRDRRDFDVLDDDSVLRGTSVDGRLRIGAESYRVVVLPGGAEVQPPTAAALRSFAESGGVVVAVGAAPTALADVARVATSPDQLPELLADVPRTVDAPVPTLLRTDGRSAVLLVVGAAPGATVQPPERAWRTEGYDFDAGRYARSVQVAVRGVVEPVALWEPGTGTALPLEAIRIDDALHVTVPLESSPCGLLVFGPAADVAPHSEDRDLPMARPGSAVPDARAVLLESWTGRLLPTLDNTWGDFARPASPGPVPFQVWRLEHRRAGQQGCRPVRATFGPRAEVREPGGEWRPVVWSDRLGAADDDKERRGYVPEEFVDLGEVAAGEQRELRIRIRSDVARQGFLTVGTTAEAAVRWNAAAPSVEHSVYFHRAAVDVVAGDNVLELTFTAATPRRLRACWSLRPAPEPLPRPEWVTGGVLTRAVELRALPESAALQLGTLGRVTLTVNGKVVARHGEFDNYSHVRRPGVRRYDVREQLHVGDNEIRLDLHEPEAAAVVDAFLDDVCITTDGTWAGGPAGIDQVPYDPRWVQLRPRPHPLPAAEGEEVGVHLGAVQPPVQPSGVETFDFALPPGAVELRLPVTGLVDVRVGETQVDAVDGVHPLPWPLPGGTPVTVRVQGGDGTGGAAWTGPVEVAVAGETAIPVGEWSRLGLRDWSGGVRYRTVVGGPVDAHALDLGEVRGTAELRVNGRTVGCRIWWPYRFDVTGLLDARDNVLEVDVYNTLAPYVAAVSGSPWVLPGQTVSGLLGPVTLLVDDTQVPDHGPSRTTEEMP